MPRRVAPTETALLAVEGLPTLAVPGPGVAGGEEDQEVLVVPHELVHVLAAGRVVVLRRGVLLVAPGVGVEARALGVGLLEDRGSGPPPGSRCRGSRRSCRPGSRRPGSRAWRRAPCRRPGRGAAGWRSCRPPPCPATCVPWSWVSHSVPLMPPLHSLDQRKSTASTLRCAVSTTVPPLQSLVGGRPRAGVAEVAHVGVDAGVEDADDLALAEDPLAEDRRRLAAARGPTGPTQIGGVVEQHAARLRGRSRTPRGMRASASRCCAISAGVRSRRTREKKPLCLRAPPRAGPALRSSRTTRPRSASG